MSEKNYGIDALRILAMFMVTITYIESGRRFKFNIQMYQPI